MDYEVIGFIGLGTMGGGMCRNLVRKFPDRQFVIYDLNPEAMAAVPGETVRQAASIDDVGASCDLVFLSMPDGAAMAKVVAELRPALHRGQTIIDTSTSDVAITRSTAVDLASLGVTFHDAPIARTREAAEQGTLAIMVGGDAESYQHLVPILSAMGTEINHCGPVGAGQVVKILNNMVVFQTVNALSEAMAIGEAEGIAVEKLFDIFSRSSADSFVLRNHGMKSLMARTYPLRAFSTKYARKDNSYALKLASGAGIRARGAELIESVLERSEQAGYGDEYFPALYKLHNQ